MDPNSVSKIIEVLDWSTLVQVIEFIAICVASATAVYGIWSWRREFVGKRRIELAEDVLVLFYEAKDAIDFIRSPLGLKDEGSTRRRGENETPEQTRALDMAYVAFERYEKRSETFVKLNSLRYRFWAQFGKDKARPFDEVREVLSDIFGAARRLARRWVRRSQTFNQTELETLSEEIRRYEAIFWSGEPEDDISNRIDAAIRQMEETCRKVIMAGR